MNMRACTPVSSSVSGRPAATRPAAFSTASSIRRIAKRTQTLAATDCNVAAQQCSTSTSQLQQQASHKPHQLSTTPVAIALAATPLAFALLAPEASQAAEIDAGTAQTIENVLRPLFNIYTLLYIVRIPMTWYPNLDIKTLPWSVFCAPTEPFLSVTRRIVPLVGGVDVTPIVWVAMISFFNEVMLGPQGILTLIQREVPGAPLGF